MLVKGLQLHPFLTTAEPSPHSDSSHGGPRHFN